MTDFSQMKQERERLALEAKRLINDQTLKTALSNIRQSAVDKLISADPTNTAEVIRYQEKTKICDEFMAELQSMIDQQTIENGSRISG